MPKIFTVSKDYNNCRFDRWFKHNVGKYPQSLIEKLRAQIGLFDVLVNKVIRHPYLQNPMLQNYFQMLREIQKM